MSQLGELINKLAIQSGMDANDEGLKALLSNAAVSGYEVPDAISNSIQGNLLTVESAKNNPKLKSHFYALAYNGLDTELNGLMGELGIDETLKAELMAETSSTKRASLLTKKVRELEIAKAGETGGNAAKLNDQIATLNQQILDEKQGRVDFEAGLNAKFQGEKKNLLLQNVLGSYDYAMPISKEANIMTAMNLLQTELTSKGLTVDVTEGNTLSLKNSEGQDYFDQNVKVDVKTFTDAVLGQHKLLQATPPAGGTPPPPTQPTGQPAPTVGGNAFQQAANEAASQFEQ